MQAGEEIQARNEAISLWNHAALDAVEWARQLHKLGVHKQVVNRVLEPYLFITVIVSATDYANFFALRCHPDAQPEFQYIAREMQRQYDVNTPMIVQPGHWHLPYVEREDKESPLYVEVDNPETLRMISTARCARVSYLTHDGRRDFQEDVDMCDRLSAAGHWSPFEHCAEATGSCTRYGNFKGWVQYRKYFGEEYVRDHLYPVGTL
jgi:thymidylate synthase ThyX